LLEGVTNYGYILARMKYDIILAPEAIEDLNELSANDRATVKAALEIHLRYEPIKISKSRIKRLRGLSKPQYRLRIGKFRVFYDVEKSIVNVLAITSKEESSRWLKEFAGTQ
jgi:mRNA interferase RelE/StbE